jgi:hypothetical protein
MKMKYRFEILIFVSAALYFMISFMPKWQLANYFKFGLTLFFIISGFAFFAKSTSGNRELHKIGYVFIGIFIMIYPYLIHLFSESFFGTR